MSKPAKCYICNEWVMCDEHYGTTVCPDCWNESQVQETPTEREAETERLRGMAEAAGWPEGAAFTSGNIRDEDGALYWRTETHIEYAVAALACDWPKLADALDAALARVEEMEQAANEEFEVLAELGEAAMTKEEIGLLVKHGRDGLKYARLETKNAALKARVAELEKQATGLCGTCAKYDGCEKREGHCISFCSEFKRLMED